ncbi:DUF1203 domain-containing protein [Afifella sp. IM 167]|uniref:DUF1203 domain-containing protein n=1 Tax=Afifella sp. IM 167 TaxID=2033586 RepID=UPI001CCAA439|nr:DUF1203 domain-containing protein [Afifella sp. IM 167]MBZ8132480.1 hypothetical protein [Afifella sp. IM 167]
MTFQIHALCEEPFAELFTLSDAELRARNIRRMVVDTSPGTPCRVSLSDAEVGETVLLLNYTHQPAETPYRASHAIFVREGAKQATPRPDEIPPALSSRLISIRLFDDAHMMVDADVVEGARLAAALARAFGNEAVAYGHLHYAKPGCFAALVRRA